MKIRSSVRRNTILGMISTTLISYGLFTLEALALPTAQILEKLNPVPVFTIADDKGAPLVATGKNGAKVAGVFISQQDANNFVTQLQNKNPDLASKVKVVSVSLEEVFKLSHNNSNNNGLNFAYVPNEVAANYAKSCETYKGGVPLFVAKGGQDNGYLTIEKDGQQAIPFFFEKQQLDDMIAKVPTQKPELADSINVEVISLEDLIDTLQTSNDPVLSRIVLVPSTESIQFLQQQNALEQRRGTVNAETERSREAATQRNLERMIEKVEESIDNKERVKNDGQAKGNIKCDKSNINGNETGRSVDEVMKDFERWSERNQERHRRLNDILRECVGWTC